MKKLLFLAALVGIIAFIARKATLDREEWEGLTEDELRSRLGERLPSQIPDDKREQITEKIVAKMKDRGAITDETIDIDEPIDLADSADAADSADTEVRAD